MNHHLFVILILVLIVIGYLAYLGYPIYEATQKGKVLMAAAVPYEQRPANATQSFLVTGDSTAYGTGAADPKDSTAGRLGAEYPLADITNLSQNGLKLEGLVEKLNSIPLNKHYDLVLIQIGANDIVGFTSPSDVRTRLNAVLEWTQTHSSHTLILTAGDVGLAPVFHFPLTWIYTQRTLMVRQIFMTEIAKYPNVTYIDLYKDRAHEPFNTNIPLYYAADHFHPSDAGYGLWYQSISAAAKSVLN